MTDCLNSFKLTFVGMLVGCEFNLELNIFFFQDCVIYVTEIYVYNEENRSCRHLNTSKFVFMAHLFSRLLC